MYYINNKIADIVKSKYYIYQWKIFMITVVNVINIMIILKKKKCNI